MEMHVFVPSEKNKYKNGFQKYQLLNSSSDSLDEEDDLEDKRFNNSSESESSTEIPTVKRNLHIQEITPDEEEDADDSDEQATLAEILADSFQLAFPRYERKKRIRLLKEMLPHLPYYMSKITKDGHLEEYLVVLDIIIQLWKCSDEALNQRLLEEMKKMSMRNNSRLAELLEIIKRILSNQLDFKSRAAVDTDVLCGSLQVLSTLQPAMTLQLLSGALATLFRAGYHQNFDILKYLDEAISKIRNETFANEYHKELERLLKQFTLRQYPNSPSTFQTTVGSFGLLNALSTVGFGCSGIKPVEPSSSPLPEFLRNQDVVLVSDFTNETSCMDSPPSQRDLKQCEIPLVITESQAITLLDESLSKHSSSPILPYKNYKVKVQDNKTMISVTDFTYKYLRRLGKDTWIVKELIEHGAPRRLWRGDSFG